MASVGNTKFVTQYENTNNILTDSVIVNNDNAAVVVTKTVSDKYDKDIIKTINNNPLCRIFNNCEDDELNVIDFGDNTNSDLSTRLYNITFERIYQNLASYPNEGNYSNKKYFIRTFYLPEDKIITVTVNMVTKNKIVTTISGETGFDKPLIKTTVIVNKTFKTEYSLGD